jgi:hypothetical protein
MAIEEGADAIYSAMKRALARNEGLLVGRNGTIELETLMFRLYGSQPGQPYPSSVSNRMELHAGIFPPTKDVLDRWVFQMVESLRQCDVLVAGWYEPLKEAETRLLDQTNHLAPRIPLRSLEPYYVPPEKRWTALLKGQRVAVVSSFADTIPKQIQKREEIWPVATESLIPSDTTWIPIRTGYAPVLAQGSAEWNPKAKTWEGAVSMIVRKVMECKARIVLVGCGGLGMVLGSELKKRGCIVIVLGGAIQVLFGIKGTRWAKHDVIQHFWNDAWVYPSADETPNGAMRIEGGCYWGKN